MALVKKIKINNDEYTIRDPSAVQQDNIKTINGESIVGTGDVTVQGEQGPAGTIAIGSVSSGTSASVTNSGTASAAVLDFVLPKGAKGDKGDKGDTGASGVHVDDTVIEQTTGTSTTSLMSQKAVTDAIANANVFSQQYGVMGFDRSTQEHSTEKYRTFLFDDLKFIDVSSRCYFSKDNYGNGSVFYSSTNFFTIIADASNSIYITSSGFNLVVCLKKDGNVIHKSEPSGRMDSVLRLYNHNIRFDFINKRVVFTNANREGVITVAYIVDMSDWDFSGLEGKQVSFSKKFEKYGFICWLYTFVKVNEPFTTTLTLHTRPYSVMPEFPKVDYYDTISREPTGLNNTWLSVTETISATHKKFSKTSEDKTYVSFFASGSNAFVNGVPLIHGVKFKLLSGSPTFSLGQGVNLYVLGEDGTLTSLWGYDFAENTEYTIISDIVLGSSFKSADYQSTYAMYGTGVFTCEVSEPFVIYPQYQILCSENIVDGAFQGNIPFSADGATLVPYTPGPNISNSYVYYHLGELKVDNGNVYMWNGIAWKQISN